MFREEEYSSTWHLAQVLFLNAAVEQPDQCWFAYMTPTYIEWAGYFDDAGSEGDTPLVSMNGFVATVEQWRFFERDWKIVLGLPQFDLEYFHMKELRQGKGRFAKFPGNLPLQQDLFDRLQRVIRCRVLGTHAGTVVQSDYWKVNQEFKVEEYFGPPLVLAGQTAIGKLVVSQQREHPSVKLKVVVDQRIKHWGKLDNAVLREAGFRMVPEKVKDSPPLQACDLIGWEQNRALTKVAIEGSITRWEDLRGSFKALIERFPDPRWFYVDEAEMRRVFEKSVAAGLMERRQIS